MTRSTPTPFFYSSRLRPCPYLPDRLERTIATKLLGSGTRDLYDMAARKGFRRSHDILYRPACPECAACVPVRVLAREFETDKSMRRILKVNADVECGDVEFNDRPPRASEEQYRLFKRYLWSRHGDGGMHRMDFEDYRAMVEDSPVDTALAEFRTPAGALVGALLADLLGDGLSAVYSFFDPDLPKQSLGTYMVLRLIERARRLDLPYAYLGYWIAQSPKMAYKARFRPLEALGPEGWRVLEG